MFRDARNAKQRDLRVRVDNPALGIAPPERGIHKAKQFLFPSEFSALVRCERVPLRWRRLFAIATYLFARAGELQALRWSDIDLERGVVLIHRGTDRLRGKNKATKGDAARRFSVEPELLPLLRAMRDEAAEDACKLIDVYMVAKLAAMFRHYLEWAGVKRAELFESDATRRAITFHDLPATGITWMAIRGEEPLKIKHRAGHASFSTTESYIREAGSGREGFGTVFPPLPASLIRPTNRPSGDSAPLKLPQSLTKRLWS